MNEITSEPTVCCRCRPILERIRVVGDDRDLVPLLVQAIADARGTNRNALAPLSDFFDLEAIEALFDDRYAHHTGRRYASVTVDDLRVFVHDAGPDTVRILVCDGTELSDPVTVVHRRVHPE